MARKNSVQLDKIRMVKDKDLRKAMLDSKPDEVFMIGESTVEYHIPAEGEKPARVEKVVEVVWAKVFRTKG